MLIDRALRDEGTSYHYLPPAEFVAAEERLVEAAMKALARSVQPVYRGASWTTDAPFRETAAAIAHCRGRQVLAVEMEAAGLYAFSRARRPVGLVLCPCHKPNGGRRGRFRKR